MPWSLWLVFFMSSCLCFLHVTSHYLPAQPLLAEAVPGSEEDYPYISCSTSFAKVSLGATCGVGMVGLPFEITVVIL